MVSPIAFGIGTGLTTLVGSVGAGAWRARSRRLDRRLTSFATIGLIGWTVAFVPEAWAGLFASDPAVIAASVSYITRVAPFYCLFGLALTLYFASQGAGRMKVPVVAGIVRMIATILAGWLAVEKFGLGLEGVFAAIAIGMATYGGLMAGLLLVAPWKLPVSYSLPARGEASEGIESRLLLRPRTGSRAHAAADAHGDDDVLGLRRPSIRAWPVRRAPVMPKGWPIEIEPPLTFSFVGNAGLSRQ